MKSVVCVFASLLFGGCSTLSSQSASPDPALAAIEARSGGRLGVVLLDHRGQIVMAHRSDERFAMCSTFKAALAAVALEGGEKHVRALSDVPIPFRKADLPSYSPGMEEALAGAEQGTISLQLAARNAVMLSDNGAANLVIDHVGGPAVVTARWRSWGDLTSRLDRKETALNENAIGDVRDTSTPRAMAQTLRKLIGKGVAGTFVKGSLIDWMGRSQTGLKRVRAGLPQGWRVGDKTGNCAPASAPNAQLNDIGWIQRPDGKWGWFAVMLDRPKVGQAEADAIHAEVGRLIAERLR